MVKKISAIWEEIISENRGGAPWLTISNVLTVLRILLVPVIVVGISHHLWSFVFVLFLVAGLTDMLDGYLARWLNEQTTLGACLDPIADKILPLQPENRSSMLLAVSRTGPSGVPIVVGQGKCSAMAMVDMVVTGHHAGCSQWYALSAALKPKYPSSRVKTDPFIAAIATIKSS